MSNEFKGNDGKTYNLEPLTFGDQREFKHFVQYRSYYAMAEFSDRFPENQRDYLIGLAFQECLKNKPTRAEINYAMHEEDGAAEMLYMSLRKSHKITRAEVIELLNDTNAREIMNQLYTISGMIGEVVETDSKKKPTQKQT